MPDIKRWTVKTTEQETRKLRIQLFTCSVLNTLPPLSVSTRHSSSNYQERKQQKKTTTPAPNYTTTITIYIMTIDSLAWHERLIIQQAKGGNSGSRCRRGYNAIDMDGLGAWRTCNEYNIYGDDGGEGNKKFKVTTRCEPVSYCLAILNLLLLTDFRHHVSVVCHAIVEHVCFG
jgi:hypothetical protein